MEMNKDSSEGVAAEVSGVGLPYAPENWPQDGDIWRWKTGRRVVPKGTHFQDRYLYLPERLKKEKEEKEIQASASKKSSHIFATKAALRKYIHTYFPETDFESFLKTFSWRIPALLDFGIFSSVTYFSLSISFFMFYAAPKKSATHCYVRFAY